jgi:hypothetical protein
MVLSIRTLNNRQDKLKSFISSHRILVVVVIFCFLAGVLLAARGWYSSAQPLPPAGQEDTASSDQPANPSSTPLDPSSTSFSVPLEEGQSDVDNQRSGKSTATVLITTKAPARSEPIVTPDPILPPPNSAPALTAVLPTSNTYLADAVDGSKQYKALVFSATATDQEDGDITNPLSFHWSNVGANCSAAGTDLCQNEKDGNSFTMNMPVSGVCPGIMSIDLSDNYKFEVTVQDSEGLTDSREIDLTITYHCAADPISVPQITIISPVAQQYPGNPFDDWGQNYQAVLFSATATDGEDGAIIDPAAFTWRLINGYCSEVMTSANMPCQTEINSNDFTMNMMGVCVVGTLGLTRDYTFELSVQDSDGNVTTEQIAFTVAGVCSDQGN